MKASTWRHIHATLTVLWFIMIPVAMVTGWMWSVAFISLCSLYANAAGHFGAFQAARTEDEN